MHTRADRKRSPSDNSYPGSQSTHLGGAWKGGTLRCRTCLRQARHSSEPSQQLTAAHCVPKAQERHENRHYSCGRDAPNTMEQGTSRSQRQASFHTADVSDQARKYASTRANSGREKHLQKGLDLQANTQCYERSICRRIRAYNVLI
jgi:hypothetical protein